MQTVNHFYSTIIIFLNKVCQLCTISTHFLLIWTEHLIWIYILTEQVLQFYFILQVVSMYGFVHTFVTVHAVQSSSCSAHLGPQHTSIAHLRLQVRQVWQGLKYNRAGRHGLRSALHRRVHAELRLRAWMDLLILKCLFILKILQNFIFSFLFKTNITFNTLLNRC